MNVTVVTPERISPVGSGGLIAGMAGAIKLRVPHVRAWGAQPVDDVVVMKEPAGAVPVAAYLAGLIDRAGKTAAVVSGGNVNPNLATRLLAA